MVWTNNEGRMQLCEAGISGEVVKMATTHSSCSGYTKKDKK